MKTPRTRSKALVTGVALATALLMAVPATVSAVTEAPSIEIPASASAAAAPTVAAVVAIEVPAPVKAVALAAPAPATAQLRKVAVRKTAPARPLVASRIVVKAARRTAVRATPVRASSSSELSRARSILASQIAKHPILRGTTVTIGRTPGGYQAVAYYTKGQIVISSSHTASLERILAHEIWHVIDWRDNGRIDWGENVPPR